MKGTDKVVKAKRILETKMHSSKALKFQSQVSQLKYNGSKTSSREKKRD